MSKFNHKSLLAADQRVTEEELANEMKLLIFERSVSRLNRRSFISTLGVAGAAAGTLAATAGLAGCSSSSPSPTVSTNPTPPSTGPSVTDVLNFALNLEYLEATFYLYLTTGTGLSAANMGTGAGAVTGGAQVSFQNPDVTQLAQELAADEQNHVTFLRSTITSIGGTPVAMPALNLTAMGAVTTDATFLTLARQLETVGVSAYAGAAQYLVSNPTAVLYGAQILDTESQHESFLRQFCIYEGLSSPAVDALDLPPTGTQIFNTSPTTGLYTTRTTSQVLQIVYAAPGKTGVASGGFFPNGLNGNIAAS